MLKTLAHLTLLLAALPFAFAQQPPTKLDQTNKSIDTLLGDHTKVQRLVADLQQAVATHKPAAVAALAHYPLKLNPGDNQTFIRTPQAFIAAYDTIITPAVAAIVRQQKYEDLFVNYQGAMFGDGQLWLMEFCLDKACQRSEIKIGTIQSIPTPNQSHPDPNPKRR